MGDFNYDNYDTSGQTFLSWFFFILATVVNCIVMLNLLIAVVSETFATVLDTKDENTYKERAGIIAENYFLLSQGQKAKNRDKNLVLMITEPKD